jgi:phenylacetate-CoA ligase
VPSLTDSLRAVVPPRIRNLLRRSAYAVWPIERRFGRDYWRLKAFLAEAQWWERRRIEEWQLEKLKSTVAHAHANVPGYRQLFREAGVKPEDIRALGDVSLLPRTTKELIRDNLKDFTAENIPNDHLQYITTGGTTGTPVGFYRTNVNHWKERAFLHRVWEDFGWDLRAQSAALRGFFLGTEEDFWKYDYSARILLLSTYYLTEKNYARYLERLAVSTPPTLLAFPSAAAMLSDMILEHGDEGRVRFELIILASENVYDWQKKRLRQAFPGTTIFSYYGQSEQVSLASWCRESESYHVWPFYGVTEILGSDGTEVVPGESGEIVGTPFWNPATPMLRYHTGDMATKGAGECGRCGRKFALLDTIEGRLQEFVISKAGRHVSMASLIMHSDVFDNVRRFQFYQDTPGLVALRVVRKDSYTDVDTRRITGALKPRLGDDIHLDIVFVDGIERTKQGKLRILEQRLDLRYGDR